MTLRGAIIALALLTLPARAGLVGWDTAAWPACGHIGSRELEPGLLYKQRWAADVFAAIEERRGAALRHDWGGTETLTVPDWWTAEGVTNRVVAFEREVLVEAKRLTRYLSTFYLNDELVDPDSFAEDYFDLAEATRQRYTNTYTNVTWYWGCPETAHPGTSQTLKSLDFGDNAPMWSAVVATNEAMRAATLEGADGLPSTALLWTPWRIWDGICAPASSYLGPSLVFRTAAVTGLCNAVTINSATATTGTVSATVVANPCFTPNDTDQAVIWVTNPGAVTATAVRVTFTVDNRMLLASPYGTQAERIPAFHAWRGAPVVAEMGDIAPGETRTVIQLDLTLAGYQGDSPHASDLWYATDFGWDTVMRALNRMRAIVYPNATISEHNPLPGWYAPGYERWSGIGDGFGGGGFSAALSDLAGGITYEPAGTYSEGQIVRPQMRYEGNFDANGTNCFWTAFFDSGRAPAHFSSPWAFPDDLEVTVSWYTEVLQTLDDGTDEEASLDLIQTVTFVASGSANNALTSEKAGGNALGSETAPTDPANGPDVGEPEDDGSGGLVQLDNTTINRRLYSSAPIALVKFQFTHRNDP